MTRSDNLNEILDACHRNGITCDTPGVADKIHNIIRKGFPDLGEKTKLDYKVSMIDILKQEKRRKQHD